MESDLHGAIANDELCLHYQPKITLNTGQVYGAEALLRWNRKNHGLVSPAVFIPVAEESDLIIELGSWVQKAAFRQLGLWKNTPYSYMRIAVNVSSKEFAKGRLLGQLNSLEKFYSVDPGLLDLEITERTVLEQSSFENNPFNQLRARGYGLSIDDFGTGYSSLSYLKSIPINELKIDRSFVNSSNEKDLAITATIVNLAKNLGIHSIAEGVEKQSQIDYLARVGCDRVQGYLFSGALPVQEFESWVSEYEMKGTFKAALQ